MTQTPGGEADDAVATGPARRPTRVDWLLVAFVVAASLPFVAGAIWAGTNHWTPTGDRALIALNAHRVFSGHPPTVGMPSTQAVELSDGRESFVSHLGPLEFGALAVPSVVSGGSPVGILVGVVAVNVASLAVAAWALARLRSRAAAGWFMAGCVALSTGLGATILWDDWNPNITLFPLLALVTSASAVVAGHRRFLPVAALFAVFVAQVHLSTVLFGLVVGAWCLVAGMVFDRRDAGPGVWRRWRRALLVTAGVVVVTWSPPLANQFDGADGNLTLLVRSLGRSQPHAGWSYAREMLERVVALPPLWVRRAGTVFDLDPLRGLDHVVAGALALGGAALVVAVVRRRRDDPARSALVMTATVVAAAAFVDLALAPASAISIAYVRWLWPVGFFVWFAVLDGALGLGREALVARRPALAGLGGDPRLSGALVATPLVLALVLAPLVLSPPDVPALDGRGEWVAIATLSDSVHDRLDGRSAFLQFHGLDAFYGSGPELLRRLYVAGDEVVLPASYGGGTSGVFAIGPGDRPDVAVGLWSDPHGLLAPKEVPTEVLGVGLDDSAAARRWVAEASAVLGGLDGAAPVVVSADLHAELARDRTGEQRSRLDDVLADGRLAMFDRAIVTAVAQGRVRSAPFTSDQAERLLDGLDRADLVAFASPSPG